MKTVNEQVENYLEENKEYDFESDYFTDDIVVLFNDTIEATCRVLDQNTKPLVDKISSLEASLLDVTRKSCARVDELTAKLKAAESVNEQQIKLNESMLKYSENQ